MGYIGMMENTLETTIVGCKYIYICIYMGFIGIMENKMETTIVGCICIGFIGKMERKKGNYYNR